MACMARVNMQEACGPAGRAVIAHTAALLHQSHVANFHSGNVGQIKVNGAALNVLALAGHMAAQAVQQCIGLRRTIAAHNVNGRVAA